MVSLGDFFCLWAKESSAVLESPDESSGVGEFFESR